MKYFIGVVTRNRYNGLEVLLNSIRKYSNIEDVVVVDSSQTFDKNEIKRIAKGAKQYIKVDPTSGSPESTSVCYMKNKLIEKFYSCKEYDYLFLVEDDCEILREDTFNKYIMLYEKYNIPHLNFCYPSRKESFIYNLNDDIWVGKDCQGAFSFYTRECIEKAGIINPLLCHNCWEHIEHTARIHQLYNYNPEFFHFPDISNPENYIKLQNLPSTIAHQYSKKSEYTASASKDFFVMLNILKWNGLPAKLMPDINPSLKFDPTSIKIL